MVSTRGFVSLGLLAGVVGTLGLLHATRLGVSFAVLNIQFPILVGTSLLCAQIYRSQGIVWLDRTVAGLECIGLLVLTSFVGALATYPLAALSTGWYEDYLAAADRNLGLDWPAYWAFVQAHGLLNTALSYGYDSIFFTPTIVLVALAATGHANHAYRFIAAFMIALIVTDITFVLLPAKSAAVHFLGMGSPDLPFSSFVHVPVIENLRSGSPQPIPAGRFVGLITVPSFHAAACALFAWAAWPVRWLRMPGLAVNGLMMAATPIIGGHYFIDLFAGVAVATAAIMVARALPDRVAAPAPHSVVLAGFQVLARVGNDPMPFGRGA